MISQLMRLVHGFQADRTLDQSYLSKPPAETADRISSTAWSSRRSTSRDLIFGLQRLRFSTTESRGVSVVIADCDTPPSRLLCTSGHRRCRITVADVTGMHPVTDNDRKLPIRQYARSNAWTRPLNQSWDFAQNRIGVALAVSSAPARYSRDCQAD